MMPEVHQIDRPEGFPARDQLGEGVCWDEADQALYWVDIVGKRAMQFDVGRGTFQQWHTPSVCSAVIPTTTGDLIVALQDGVYRLAPETGVVRPYAHPDPDPLNRSNDARVDPLGRLWLGTMSNNIAPDGSSIPLRPGAGGLFLVESGGRHRRMLDGIGITNAIAFSPDGRRMSFADTRQKTIWTYAVDPETGDLSDRQVLLQGGPGSADGAAMDEDGCLWNARWGAGVVLRITPDGRIDRTVQVPALKPSCCAFGGPDRRTLYITSARQDIEAPSDADGALFAVDVGVAGLPTARFAS